jgi:hypothetical protein
LSVNVVVANVLEEWYRHSRVRKITGKKDHEEGRKEGREGGRKEGRQSCWIMRGIRVVLFLPNLFVFSIQLFETPCSALGHVI